MSDPGSLTIWLDRLKRGDDREEAVRHLWQAYFARLVQLAARNLSGRHGQGDEEDAALSAFQGFVSAVEAGRFPNLEDRKNLWRILLELTANKCRNHQRDEHRLKRGGYRSILSLHGDGPVLPLPSREPDPAEALAMAEDAKQLMNALQDHELQHIAELAMQGHTNGDIARAINKSLATVERKLKRIRTIWMARSPD